MKLNKLTKEEENIIVKKGTEMPFTGEYDNNFKEGTYICRRCNAPLYRSKDKFDAHCGWPAFDDEIPGAIKHVHPDALHVSLGATDELQCARCGAYLGHQFNGEGFTPKNTRACVNSLSMRFVPKGKEKEIDKDGK